MTATPFTSYMPDALQLAKMAETAGEVPVGAVVIKDGQIIGRGHNMPRTSRDPSAHAEIVAIRDACKHLRQDRLEDCDLWVTLEPCTMCAGAISHARIARLYYGATDPKGGAVESGVRFYDSPTCHHRPEIYTGLEEEKASMLLRGFFREQRNESAG